MIRWVLLAFVLSNAAHAQWESSLATVASLRTGGASLVSSDAMALGDGQLALITYWEARSDSNLDVYRCVDITDGGFETIRQACWRALRPAGRAPRVAEDVTSSEDLCGRPNIESTFGSIAFCAFSKPFVVRTPHFELTLVPFEAGGLVAARERGGYLVVTDEALPASVFFEVRADSLAAFTELSGLAGPDELLRQPSEGLRCESEEVTGRQWIVCRAIAPPLHVIRYLLADGVVYTVTFDAGASPADSESIELMFDSLRPGPPR
jgi:hypothetical protein